MAVSIINLLGGTVVASIGWFCIGSGIVCYWFPIRYWLRREFGSAQASPAIVFFRRYGIYGPSARAGEISKPSKIENPQMRYWGRRAPPAGHLDN